MPSLTIPASDIRPGDQIAALDGYLFDVSKTTTGRAPKTMSWTEAQAIGLGYVPTFRGPVEQLVFRGPVMSLSNLRIGRQLTAAESEQYKIDFAAWRERMATEAGW